MFTLRGRLERPNGTPHKGRLIFFPSPAQFTTPDGVVKFAEATAELAEDGSFSVELAHMPGLTYHVRFIGGGSVRPFWFEVPQEDGAALDLSEVVPLEVPKGLDPALYVPVPSSADTAAAASATSAAAAQTAAEQAQENAAASAQAAQDAALRAGTITGVSLDTDGTPYFDSTGTAILAVDTDGTPYIY